MKVRARCLKSATPSRSLLLHFCSTDAVVITTSDGDIVEVFTGADALLRAYDWLATYVEFDNPDFLRTEYIGRCTKV